MKVLNIITCIFLTVSLSAQSSQTIEIESNSGGNSVLQLKDATSATFKGFDIQYNGTNDRLEFRANHTFTFFTEMVLNSSGRLGIGTIDPQSLLHVNNSSGEADIILSGTTGNLSLDYREGASYKGGLGWDTNNDRIFLYQGGNVFFGENGKLSIPSLDGKGVRRVFVDNNGELNINAGNETQVHTLHYADFIPTDYDDTYGDIDVSRIHRHVFVRSSGDINDVGYLSAPLHLPSGTKVTGIKAYYINETSDPFTFTIKKEDKFGAFSSTNLATRVAWVALPEQGYYNSSLGITSVVQHTEDIGDFVINGNSLYTIEFYCANCSEQYVRAVDIEYLYE